MLQFCLCLLLLLLLQSRDDDDDDGGFDIMNVDFVGCFLSLTIDPKGQPTVGGDPLGPFSTTSIYVGDSYQI